MAEEWVKGRSRKAHRQDNIHTRNSCAHRTKKEESAQEKAQEEARLQMAKLWAKAWERMEELGREGTTGRLLVRLGEPREPSKLRSCNSRLRNAQSIQTSR